MKKLDLDKKQINIVMGVIFAVMVFILIIFAYRPLVVKIRLMEREFKAIGQEVASARAMLKAKDEDGLEERGRLITRREVSLAIDEITNAGRELDINFISINPQEIVKIEGSEYKRLPINLDLESEYKNIGLFLGALEGLKESMVTVRSFKMERHEELLARVKSKLILDMYLQGDEPR